MLRQREFSMVNEQSLHVRMNGNVRAGKRKSSRAASSIRDAHRQPVEWPAIFKAIFVEWVWIFVIGIGCGVLALALSSLSPSMIESSLATGMFTALGVCVSAFPVAKGANSLLSAVHDKQLKHCICYGISSCVVHTIFILSFGLSEVSIVDWLSVGVCLPVVYFTYRFREKPT